MDNYKCEKIKKWSYKNIRYCYVEGPTGPRGEPWPMGLQGKNGPTTINIGLCWNYWSWDGSCNSKCFNSVLAGLKENDNITINIKSENNVILTASNSTSDNLEVLKIP